MADAGATLDLRASATAMPRPTSPITFSAGTATSSAGDPPLNISTPSMPDGQVAAFAGLAAIVMAACWHATVVTTWSASVTEVSVPTTCGSEPCSQATVVGWVTAPPAVVVSHSLV